MYLTGFDFTEEDLRANQRGFVTPRQTEWVRGWAEGIRHSQRSGWPIVIFFLILGLGLILGMNLSNESTRRVLLSDPLIIVVICSIAPLVLGIFGLSVFFANRRAAKLAEVELKTAEGTVRLDEEHSRVGTTYYVYVGDTEFTFGADMSRVFPEGSRCRIFYCETSMLKVILSHEALD